MVGQEFGNFEFEYRITNFPACVAVSCRLPKSCEVHTAALNQIAQLDGHQVVYLLGHGKDVFHGLFEVVGHFVFDHNVEMQVGDVADAVGHFQDFGFGRSIFQNAFQVSDFALFRSSCHLLYQPHHLLAIFVEMPDLLAVAQGHIFKQIMQQGGFQQHMVGVVIVEQDGKSGHHVPELVAADFARHANERRCFLDVGRGNELHQLFLFDVFHKIDEKYEKICPKKQIFRKRNKNRQAADLSFQKSKKEILILKIECSSPSLRRQNSKSNPLRHKCNFSGGRCVVGLNFSNEMTLSVTHFRNNHLKLKHMKTMHKLGMIYIVMALALLAPIIAQAQTTKGNKNVVKQERAVTPFIKIVVSGAFDVFLTQQPTTSLTVEADENLMDKITTEVNNQVLTIGSRQIKNPTKLNVYISSPTIEFITMSGASTLVGENTLQGQVLDVTTSGATDLRLNVNVEILSVNASGASAVILSGTAKELVATASGAADIKASKLQVTDATVDASGAANIDVNASGKVVSTTSGAGDIDLTGKPAEIENHNERTNVRSWKEDNKTIVKAGSVMVEVTDSDSTKVSIGGHNLIVDDRGNVKWERNRKQKFNGHWAGVELGVNGYLTDDFNTDIKGQYDFLNLKYEKSIEVNINFFEQNFNLIDEKFGVLTGLGLRWNNYRLDDNIILESDAATIEGFADNSRDWRKSKLVANYLTLPILFEYQSNRFSRRNSFHVATGMVMGWRYATHTKMLYFDNGRQKPKQRDSFHLRPFRYDATLRAGWGIINLYATYSLNSLFKDGRGPDLYPFSIGITLANF